MEDLRSNRPHATLLLLLWFKLPGAKADRSFPQLNSVWKRARACIHHTGNLNCFLLITYPFIGFTHFFL